MKTNINRKLQLEIGDKRLDKYYDKYSAKIDKLADKGINVHKMSKFQLEQVILATRGEFGRKGKYASDMINTIVDRQVYEGGMSYRSAASFKKALGLTQKVKDLRKIDREILIETHRNEIESVWKSIKNNPEEIKRWNSILGTNYSEKEGYKILSNYFFGSK